MTRPSAAPPRPHRALMSFHYFQKADMRRLVGKFASRPMIFADSGAYSAVTQGMTIDLEDYAQWLKRYDDLFCVYANLDVIGDAEATWRNQRRLEAMGLRPLPVYHTGEPWSYFDRYCKTYPYVALGGAVGYPTQKLMPWAVECFRRARRIGSKTVFHGFGLTSLAAITSLPWYSCDSSSWGMGYRFGQIAAFDPAAKRFEKAEIFDPKGIMKIAPLIRAHGVDPGAFLDRKKYHWRFAAALSARSWRAMEEWLRKRHGEIRMPGAEDGFHLYYATGRTGGEFEVNKALAGTHLYLADAQLGQNRQRAANEALAGPHVYLAVAGTGTTMSDEANKALAGAHVYLADSNGSMHQAANAALTTKQKGKRDV